MLLIIILNILNSQFLLNIYNKNIIIIYNLNILIYFKVYIKNI